MITGKTQVGASIAPLIERAAPLERLNPYASHSTMVEPFPLYQGRPYMPELWVRGEPVVSMDGTAVDGSRPDPWEIDTKASLRFLAGAHWDALTGIWEPFMGSGGYMYSPPVLRPPEVDIVYRSGYEVFTRKSWRISQGRGFIANIDRVYLNAMTISMVVMLNPSSNPYSIMDFADPVVHDRVPQEGERTALRYTNKIDFLYGGTGGSVDPIAPVSRMRPMFLTMTILPPVVRTYVSYSPRHMFSGVKVAQRIHPMNTKFGFGIDWKNDTSSDYNLFEVNLYDTYLSTTDVARLHSTYISTYGTHDAWT